MQDQYVGDIGDFAKLALLRALVDEHGGNPASLGVVWWLTMDSRVSNDGGFTSYLSEPNASKYRSLDQELHRQLAEIIKSEGRCVSRLERSGAVPVSTRWFNERLMHEAHVRAQRLSARARWIDRALSAVSSCDLVFLDPDNGLRPKATDQDKTCWRTKGPKYVFFDECQRFWSQGHSLVIYHHPNRSGKHEVQQARLVDLLNQLTCRPAKTEVWRFAGHGTRFFCVALQDRHAAVIGQRFDEFTERWKRIADQR